MGAEWFSWTSKEIACSNGLSCSAADYLALAPQAPLSAKPFSSVLKRELDRDEAAALEVAEHLFARDPRSVDARIVLANHALQTGDIEAFGNYYYPLFSIMRHDQRRFAEPLVELSSNPAVFSETKERLRGSPAWGNEYLLAFLGADSPPFSALAPIFEFYPHLRGHLLSSMVRNNQTKAAYSYFVSGLSEDDLERLGVPFNSQFEPSDAPRPFNWRIVSKNAEILEQGGLFAYYQSEGREQFFRQIIPLGPGRYRLTASFDGDRPEPSGLFEWQVLCARSKLELAVLALDDLASETRSELVDFEVPQANCEFQMLVFHGVPGLLKKPARINLRDVSIDVRDANP